MNMMPSDEVTDTDSADNAELHDAIEWRLSFPLSSMVALNAAFSVVFDEADKDSEDSEDNAKLTLWWR